MSRQTNQVLQFMLRLVLFAVSRESHDLPKKPVSEQKSLYLKPPVCQAVGTVATDRF